MPTVIRFMADGAWPPSGLDVPVLGPGPAHPTMKVARTNQMIPMRKAMVLLPPHPQLGPSGVNAALRAPEVMHALGTSPRLSQCMGLGAVRQSDRHAQSERPPSICPRA